MVVCYPTGNPPTNTPEADEMVVGGVAASTPRGATTRTGTGGDEKAAKAEAAAETMRAGEMMGAGAVITAGAFMKTALVGRAVAAAMATPTAAPTAGAFLSILADWADRHPNMRSVSVIAV
jgi:hypothetical protein